MLTYASWTELFQLVVASIGFCFAIWAVWDASKDAIFLGDSPPGDLRRLIALGNMLSQLARLTSQGVLVLIGMISTLLPPPPYSENTNSMDQAMFVRLGLVLVTVILTGDWIVQRRHRDAFLDRLAPSHPMKPATVSVVVAGAEVAKVPLPITMAHSTEPHPPNGLPPNGPPPNGPTEPTPPESAK